ncbi:hypothetical protein C8R43DRAFT_957334 [Mycena crocata]|nr:hypothetical protein C8R43DRAFT_957334 [Mycena crocata]
MWRQWRQITRWRQLSWRQLAAVAVKVAAVGGRAGGKGGGSPNLVAAVMAAVAALSPFHVTSWRQYWRQCHSAQHPKTFYMLLLTATIPRVGSQRLNMISLGQPEVTQMFNQTLNYVTWCGVLAKKIE